MTEGEPRVAFVTLGCKVNQADTEAIADALGGAGSCSPEDAEIVVVNTCTVTGEADHKARKAVRHALALPRSPRVIVTGCLATLDAEGLRSLGERVVVEAEKERVADIIRGLSGVSKPPATSASRGTRSRVQLKVEDGCDSFCTYCIVPYARGVPRPVPVTAVVARAEQLVRAGVREIVLTGINIGRYDDGGTRLPGLIEAVAATGVARIRLSSVEPRDVGASLLDVAARTPAFCQHLHIPLQSGSDDVLACMGRPYDTAAFAQTVARVRDVFPSVAITTDVIAGFPGETEAEAAATLAFVEAQGFSRLHVFRYSPRTGTPAAEMGGQVPSPVKTARAAALRDLGERLAVKYAASRVGTVAEVLVERERTAGAEQRADALGVTREYLRATIPGADARPGTVLDARVEAAAADGSIICRTMH